MKNRLNPIKISFTDYSTGVGSGLLGSGWGTGSPGFGWGGGLGSLIVFFIT